jgi:hypothetical protein
VCDDVFIPNGELQSALCEQSTLIGKGTALTQEEKQLFRVFAVRINRLLNNMIRECSAIRHQQLPVPSARWIYLN